MPIKLCLPLLAMALLLATPARADVGADMEAFWGGLINITGPQSFEGQSGGYYTLGSLYARAPVRREQLASIQLPGWRAGCGGIDVFTGSFSFINGDQIVQLSRAIAQNAVGFAFELALETISPVIAETMGKLRSIAQEINSLSINSCETAQALVGGIWPQTDRASAMICEAVGSAQGIFADYAASRHGCGAGGMRSQTTARASGALADAVVMNRNIAWGAIRSSPILRGDRELAELAMSLTGTIVFRDPDPAVEGDETIEPFAPLPVDANALEAFLVGGAVDGVADCVDADCLQIVTRSLTIPPARAFQARVAALLGQMVMAVRRDQAPPPAAVELVRASTLPVWRIINVAAARRGLVVEADVDALAGLIALDMLYAWLLDVFDLAAAQKSRMPQAGIDGIEAWAASLNENRRKILTARSSVTRHFGALLDVVEKYRLIEAELASAASARALTSARFAEGLGGTAESLLHGR